MEQAKDPVIDSATRSLRRLFKFVNKEADRLERKAAEEARQAERVRRREERLANRPSAKERKKLAKTRAEAIAELVRYEEVVRCSECKCELHHTDEADPIQLCRACSSRLRELIPGFRPNDPTEFSEVSIVPGGAPGSGRRR